MKLKDFVGLLRRRGFDTVPPSHLRVWLAVLRLGRPASYRRIGALANVPGAKAVRDALDGLVRHGVVLVEPAPLSATARPAPGWKFIPASELGKEQP